MKSPVNFELAKLLKEKGWEIPCFHYYENEKLIEPYLENGSSTDVEFRVDLSDLKEHFNKWSKRVSAPTIAEVVMWLYEKHGVWIIVETLGDKKDYPRFDYKTISLSDLDSDTKWLMKKLGVSYEELIANSYNTPTEAYEAAIEYTLKNLIK